MKFRIMKEYFYQGKWHKQLVRDRQFGANSIMRFETFDQAQAAADRMIENMRGSLRPAHYYAFERRGRS